MTQQPAANFVSTATVAFTLTNDGGNSETEIAASVPTGGITTTEILDGTIANADISSSANIANSKLANSGVTAGTYPSTGGVIPLLTINSKGIITAVSESANVDESATNEGRLGVGAGGSNDALLTSNTSGATGVTYAGGTAISVSETTNTNGGTITITNTGDTDGSNDLTVSDTTWRVLSSSTHFKYPTAAAVYNAIIAGGTARPDSAWAKSPSGSYTGKRITDNVYRTGKMGVGTTDTTAMLNLKPKNPVGSGLTWVTSILPPNRSAYTGGTWTNGSRLDIQTIDPNPMKPNHYPSFVYGRWTDVLSVDSATNLAAGKPGNLIRNRGWNQSGENPSLARWNWSNEQHYVPPGSTLAEWEEHIEIVDTMGRWLRPVNYRGRHNGDFYGVGFSANDWYVSKPHNSGFLLRIRGDGSNTGKWSTDYPYTFQINNTTRIGPLMERLHKSAYRNVLDWTANGRLDVGDSSGVSVQNRLQIIRANATQPEIISPEGYVVFDSTQIRVNSTDANNRHIVIQRPGTSHTWGLNYSATNFAFEADYSRTPFSIARTAPSTAFTINATGRVGLGIGDAYSLIHAQQPANDLTGGLILAPTTGNYFGLFVNGSNEVVFNRSGTDRMFLTDAGQLKLPAYTSTSSFPITAAGILGFNSAGVIGTVAGITGTGSGTAGQIAVFDGSSSVTGYTSFTRSGSNIIVGPSGSDHVEIMPGTSEVSFFDAGNVDARLKANGSVLETNVGMSIGGNSTIAGTLGVGSIATSAHFIAPGITSSPTGSSATTASGTFLAFAASGADSYVAHGESGRAYTWANGSPASSNDFLWKSGAATMSAATERMRLTSAGSLGIGVSPSEKLHVAGNALLAGKATIQSTGTNAALYIGNTTASTGKEWYINSVNAGSLVVGNATTADVLTINGTTGATTITPALTLSTTSGTAASILGLTSGNVVAGVTLGSGLSLSGGTLSATGGSGSPGGSTTQVQYNNSGSFDGATGLTVDGSENVSVTQAVSFSGDIAPSNLSGTNNDYAPTGFSTASTLLQTNSSGAIVTGIAGGADGRWITWHNTGSNNLIFRNENALSTAANRLLLGGGDVTLRADGTAGFRYDATASRWRLVYLTSFSSGAKVYEYTSGTANFQLDIPAGAKAAHITAVGAGGGGGSGRRGASGSNRCGGGGGAAGGLCSIMYPLEGSDAATFYINVGTGGTGGTAITANSTSGNTGGTGGESDVRVDGTASTDRIIRAQGGTGGTGGTATAGTGGTASTITDFTALAGTNAGANGGAGTASTGSNNRCPGPGAGGGGVTSGGAENVGGNGGAGYLQLQSGGTTNGSTTAAAIDRNRESGGGGAGGSGVIAGSPIPGGDGKRGGGGGGGGAGTDNAVNGAAGGNGGDGYVKIVFYF